MLTRIPVARRVLTQQVLTVFILFFYSFPFSLTLGITRQPCDLDLQIEKPWTQGIADSKTGLKLLIIIIIIIIIIAFI